MAHDLVIRGGLVVDGRGGEPTPGDVAVDGGTITAVGSVPGGGTEEIDAGGQLVTPGFVDIHTHYDGQVTWDSSLAPSSWHGVTTVVMGNCGVGFAPVRPDAHHRLISLMEGVEDIPGAVLDEGIDWSWETFGEYLNAVERRPHEIDVAAQLPHGALRLYVMGERAARLEEATEEDARSMRSIATEAMRAGALGFTTSRTLNHRTSTGDPTPSLRATAHELKMIVAGVADAGHGVVELISDFSPDLDGEFDLIRTLVARTGRPLSVSLAQNNHRPDGWRTILDKVAAAVADGLPIRAQVAPRPVGLLLGLQSSFHPFSLHHTFQPLAGTPLADQVRTLRDPSFRQRLLEETPPGGRRLTDYRRMFPLGQVPDYEPAAELSVAASAAARGMEPAEVALDLLLEDEGRNFLFAPFSNYATFNLDACGEMMAHDDTLFGLGDGGAHVGIISDASFPTYALSHWGRDRAHGRFEVGWLVEQMTRRTAHAVGLFDRGVIAPGLRADLNVIDFDRLRCERPTMAYDLPGGGKRLLQKARGYSATIVAGQLIAREGESTGALPGHLVRGPQPDPR
ncbi:MAG TPA: amidohydrolase family protein [Acidimicrobiales bacterium]|nr:amidohydrolase family protein [Acidimicrobiales bacterium]